MTDWSRAYGAEGDAFPVRPGDVWRCGPNRIACLDLEDRPRAMAWQDELARAGGASMAFVDPPFNAALARGFRTKAGVDGAVGRPVTFGVLLTAVLEALSVVVKDGPVWIEMGLPERSRVVEALRSSGWPGVESWSATYGGHNPCAIIRAARQEADRLEASGPAGRDDSVLPSFAIARDARPGGVVYDPCAGRGLTATAAFQAGRVFVGSELAPRRVSVTLARLSALCGQMPTREGVL